MADPHFLHAKAQGARVHVEDPGGSLASLHKLTLTGFDRKLDPLVAVAEVVDLDVCLNCPSPTEHPRGDLPRHGTAFALPKPWLSYLRLGAFFPFGSFGGSEEAKATARSIHPARSASSSIPSVPTYSIPRIGLPVKSISLA